MKLYHVVIEYAGAERETADFETEEKAKEFLEDAIGPASNSRGYIYQD